MQMIENPDVAAVFERYPKSVRKRLMHLRRLILATASETGGVGKLEETLKWGEPSYVTTESKSGSTVRLGWKKSNPHQYALHFHCSTTLVETFREIYRDSLAFEGNRSIVFDEQDEVPESELKHCIALALTYHRVKHLPMLGA